MKHIRKRNVPAELARWIENQPIENGKRLNCRYEHMPTEVKRVVKQRLLEEQGRLCCYTGLRIDESKSHIEHFRPQELCVGLEDVDYNNLLAAYPGEQHEGQYGKCRFGAHKKSKWYDEDLLISPLRGDCESRFKFDQFGKIIPTDKADRAAAETIRQLGLDDGSLVELRKQAIQAALFYKNQPLRPQQLGNIAQNYCQSDHNHEFRAFCFVITQAAQQLLHKAKRKRKSKQHSHKQGHK